MTRGLSRRTRRAIAWMAALAGCAAASAQSQSGKAPEGAQRYMTYCAGCHGADGKGGERAPALAMELSARTRTDAELFRIVHDGTDAGMPPFGQIGDANIQAIIRYLRVLEGANAPANTPVSGDAAAGRELFYGKAGCARCHMVEGQGGFIARELTTFARNRTEEAVTEAITTPDKPLLPATRVATITMRNGQTLTGVLRYEDNFSVALETEDGRYHLLARSGLTAVQVTDHSLMPRDYGTRLTAGELEDVAAFLMRVSRSEPER